MKSRAWSPAALAVLWLPFAIGAVLIFPAWDDGWLWMLIDEQGPGAIRSAFNDRPLNGLFWRLQAPTNDVFWITQLAWHAVLWPLLGWLAAKLYRELFPESARYRWLAACLVVAPLFTTVQMIAANVATASLLPVALAYGAGVAMLRFVRDGSRSGKLALALSLPLAFAAVLYQEYAIPVMGIAVVLMARHLLPGGDAGRRRRAFLACVVATVATVAAYALFSRTAVKWRGDVGLRHLLTQDPMAIPVHVAQALARALESASLGAVLRWSEAPAAAIPFGLMLGVIVAALLWRGLDASPESDRASAGPLPSWVVVAVALAVGLIPVAAMGRRPWDPGDGMTSRFALPVLPLLAMLVTRAVAALPERAARAGVVALALLAGTSTVCDVWSAVAERQRIATLGSALGAQLAQQPLAITVAVVPMQERASGPPRQWELTARLGWDWPGEQRRALWAHRHGGGAPLSYPEEATVVFGARDHCRPAPHRLLGAPRQLVRRGIIERLLWVANRPDGTVDIEPYCLRPGTETGS